MALVAPSFARAADVRLNGETLLIVNEVPVFAFKSGGRERAESIAKDLRSLQGGEFGVHLVDSDAGGSSSGPETHDDSVKSRGRGRCARSVASRWLAHDWACQADPRDLPAAPLAVSQFRMYPPRRGHGSVGPTRRQVRVRRAQVQVDDSSIATATLAGGELSVRARSGRAVRS